MKAWMAKKHKYGIKAWSRDAGTAFICLVDNLEEKFRELRESNCEILEWWKI